MNQEQLKAQLLLKELEQKQAFLNEFEKLRPTWKSRITHLVSSLLLIAGINWLYPEIIEQPVTYLLLLLIIGVSAEIHNESKKINQRIDVLYRVLKDEIQVDDKKKLIQSLTQDNPR